MCMWMAARYDDQRYRDSRVNHNSRDHPSARRSRDARRVDVARSRVAPQRPAAVVETKAKLRQVGEWSEHVSSSGKRYYYNSRTEVSQWEQPSDWANGNRRQDAPVNSSVDSHRPVGSNSRSWKDAANDGRVRKEEERGRLASDVAGQSSAANEASRRERKRPRRDHSSSSSPSESSFPRWRPLEQACDKEPPRQVANHVMDGSARPQPDGIAGVPLPQILLDFAGRCGIDLHEADAIERLKRSISDMKTASTSATTDGADDAADGGASPSVVDEVPMDTSPAASSSSAVGSAADVRGSPERAAETVAPAVDERAVSPPLPSLAATHKNFAKPSAAAHVYGWAAEHFEAQSWVHEKSRLQCSFRLSEKAVDMKCARSLVRTAEIRSTLLEQKIMFARKQVCAMDPANKTH